MKCKNWKVVAFLICLPFTLLGQGFFNKITQPDGVGGKIVATHLDGAGGMSAFGPGLDIFVRYNLGQQGFINVGTGYRTITDKTLSMDVWKVTLLPTFEIQGGYNLLKGQSVSPFVKGGLQAFGSSWTSKFMGQTFTSDKTVYDAAGFIGAGIAYDVNDKVTLHAGGDYRYVFTAEGSPKPKHWVAQVGMTYALRPSSKPKGDEIEYDFGQDELALDDLFQDETTNLDDLFGDIDSGTSASGSDLNEDDALALLFSPEEESSAMGIEQPLYSETPEVNDLLSRIEYLKGEMDKRNQQIEELQNVVRANERAIAELSGQVVGDYAGFAAEQSYSGSIDASGFKGSYEKGLQKFYNKQYQEAIRTFQGLLSSNPDHRLASNCRYWIGESYNAMGQHREAINAFSAVMRYRNSYKFDDALLMNGICHMKIGDKNSARENFQELVSRYPDSEYAPKAMRYLGML